jgi:ElaB/YqjD/DUF883 family membrane-anchored ribosome-binding protein
MPQNGAGETASAQTTTTQTPGASPPAAPAPNWQELHTRAEKDLAETRARLQKIEADSKETAKALKAKEALEQDRLRNPAKHLKELFGENWYDAATKLKSGNVAPEHVSAALDEREQRILSRVEESLKPLREENEQLKRESAERTKQDFAAKAESFVKENAAKFDLVNRYKQAGNLGGFIEGHYNLTGELWTPEQGAAELEKYWAGVRDMVLKSENGRQLADTLGATPKPLGSQERTEEPAPVPEAERKRRIEAAFNNWVKQPQGSRPN